MIQLQVLICTLGQEGIERVAACNHPKVEGVEYLVSWQLTDGPRKIPEALQRPDFKIITNTTRGLSRNRNIALIASTAPTALIADDDVKYNAESLRKLIAAFEAHPEADVLLCRALRGDGLPFKPHPDKVVTLAEQPKGYYVISFEIAFRTAAVKRTGLLFNEMFGIGAPLPMGEESVWLTDVVKAGLKVLLIPIDICIHPGLTTSERKGKDPAHIGAKGAAVMHMHPFSWPLRMIAIGRRESEGLQGGLKTYVEHWMNGVRLARRLKAFRRPSRKHRHK